MAQNQNIKLGGKPYNPDQGKIPAGQQAARDLRAQKREEQRPRSAGKVVLDSIKGAVHTGMSNFLDNMNREPPAPRQAGRSGKGSRRDRGGGGIDVGPSFNPDVLDLGGSDIDFSMHPDPAYRNIGRGRGSRRGHGGPRDDDGARTVTITRTTYRY